MRQFTVSHLTCRPRVRQLRPKLTLAAHKRRLLATFARECALLHVELGGGSAHGTIRSSGG